MKATIHAELNKNHLFKLILFQINIKERRNKILVSKLISPCRSSRLYNWNTRHLRRFGGR